MSDNVSPVTDVGVGITYGTWAIVGIVVSVAVAIAGLIVVGIMVFICCQTKKKRRRLRIPATTLESEPPSSRNNLRILPVRTSAPAPHQNANVSTEDSPPNYNDLTPRSGPCSANRSTRRAT